MKDEQKKETYLSFYFFKAREPLYGLNPEQRAHLSKGFEQLLAYHRDTHKLDIRLYSCKGYREEADFLVWLISQDYEWFNSFYVGFDKAFGGFFKLTCMFQGMTKRSQYFKEERPQNFQFGPSKLKYMFVYPFAKTDAWYQEPKEKRDEMMKEHRTIAVKFAKVFTNTVYSFGLGDHEFLLAFETDYPKEFSDLLQALRETKARIYTKYDIPIIPCINKPEADVIKDAFVI